MQNAKFRWSKVYESAEEELVDFLTDRNIQASRLVAEAGDAPIQHTADRGSTIWCAEGSLAVTDSGGRATLQAGDALRLDHQANYSLQPGFTGFICYFSD